MAALCAGCDAFEESLPQIPYEISQNELSRFFTSAEIQRALPLERTHTLLSPEGKSIGSFALIASHQDQAIEISQETSLFPELTPNSIGTHYAFRFHFGTVTPYALHDAEYWVDGNRVAHLERKIDGRWTEEGIVSLPREFREITALDFLAPSLWVSRVPTTLFNASLEHYRILPLSIEPEKVTRQIQNISDDLIHTPHQTWNRNGALLEEHEPSYRLAPQAVQAPIAQTLPMYLWYQVPNRTSRLEPVREATFKLCGENCSPRGTGFWVSNDGWFLTAKHLLAHHEPNSFHSGDILPLQIASPENSSLPLHIEKISDRLDYILGRADLPHTPCVSIASPHEPDASSDYYIVGYPSPTPHPISRYFSNGIDLYFSEGHLIQNPNLNHVLPRMIPSLSRRTSELQNIFLQFIQNTAAHSLFEASVGPGQSGGPIVNSNGQVTGIVSLWFAQSLLAYQFPESHQYRNAIGLKIEEIYDEIVEEFGTAPFRCTPKNTP